MRRPPILALVLLAAVVHVEHAMACDRVEYTEAKAWSTPKLTRAYCDALTESFKRLEADLNRVMVYDRRDMERCSQQIALYKRLLEDRGKLPPSCK
jgi:hypothetical protein